MTQKKFSFRRYLSVLAVVVGLSVGCSDLWANDHLVLVDSGKSDYSIVLPEKPTPVEKTAATELQSYTEKSTGVKLPIVSEKNVTGDHRILIGATVEGQKLLGDTKLDALKYDAIVLKTFGPKIVLAGHKQRGTLYAVYTFLEDQLGVRWWAATEETVPKHESLTIGKLDTVYAPKIQIRESFYLGMFKSPFAARNKCNGNRNLIPPEFGGHQRFNMFVHTFHKLLPPDKYFKDHPEWYSLLRGKRTHERGQLCLTNDEMRKELTKNAIERLRKDPTAALISISQSDWLGQCTCEKCLAIKEAEGSPAGLLLQFVNQVAEDIEKEFPDVLVETLAYSYTRKPPKTVRPRKNVVVRLCSIECSFAQPLDSEINKEFRDDIRGWAAIAPQLYVWDYVTNFTNYLLPHPNLSVLAPNIRFFEKNNVIGLFEQGDYQGNIGNFVRMRAWIIARLMWDSSQNSDELIDEFLTGYYGPAAPHLKSYLSIIGEKLKGSDYHMSCFNAKTNAYMDLDVFNRATKAFDQAESAVKDDPILRDRVDRARMTLDLAWIRRWLELRQKTDLTGEPFDGIGSPGELLKSYIARAKKYNIGLWREGRQFDEKYIGWLQRIIRNPSDVPPAACKDLPRSEWVDYNDTCLGIYSYGKFGELKEDPQASDKGAVVMPGNHSEWATTIQLYPEDWTGGRWRCFVVARAEGNAKDGNAMTMGIYDKQEKKSITSKAVPVSEAFGGYKAYDLGAHDLNRSATLWIAPPKRPGEVDAVYVDRVYFVKEK
jgi:Domain of unknown function (DUF4838)/Glycosyl hydrolase family 67 N-terminus